MIKITEKSKCCGCSACSEICPKGCIEMKADQEGFLYPTVDNAECINCGRCEKVCPILNKCEIHNELKQTYAVQNIDKAILKESTSGGFYTALSEWVIDSGGVVFGASYNDSYYISHSMVDKKENLSTFRNSKYTQSDIAGTYKACKKKLEGGMLVCFSGTPCEIAGLNSYLGKRYDNLILTDVVCRGVPSPLLFKKYIDWNGGAAQIKDVKFRDKKYGYYSSTMSIYKQDGSVIRREIITDPMISFFFRDLCSRPSCYDCQFKTKDRVSDFTMFDCWHANQYSNEFGCNGATAVVARNERAVQIMDELLSNKLKGLKIDFNTAIYNDGMLMFKCADMNPERDAFFSMMENESFQALLDKYMKRGGMLKCKIILKSLLMKTGLFNLLKKQRLSK